MNGQPLNDVQGFECVCPGAALGQILQPLGMNNGLEVEQSALENFIDYNKVEFFGLRHLQSSILHAQINDVGRVFPSAFQARA